MSLGITHHNVSVVWLMVINMRPVKAITLPSSITTSRMVDFLLAPLEDAAGELAHELGVQGVGLCRAAAGNSVHVVPDI